MIQPHGGKLVDRVLTDKKRDAALTGPSAALLRSPTYFT